MYHLSFGAKNFKFSKFFARTKSGPGGPPPNRNVVLGFWLNFSWDMPKMHYFSNKFSKIDKPPFP